MAKRLIIIPAKGLTYDYLWDNTNSVWILFRRAYNDYIDNTTFSQKLLGQILSGTDWENVYRGNSSYNSNNNLLSNTQQNWDVNTQSWINSFRLNLDYYADASEHHFKFENWDALTGSWSSGFRTTNTDISCTQSMQLIPVFQVNRKAVLLPQNIAGKNLLHRMPQAQEPAYNSIQRIFNPFAGNGKNPVYDINVNNGGKQYAFELVFAPASKPNSINSNATEDAAAAAELRSFVLSPNPARNYFNIDLSSWKNAGDIMLRLSDVSGKLIMQQKMIPATQRINLPSLQKGLYIVTVTSGKQVQTQKLLVE